MNLIPIPRSSSELAHLDRRGFGYGAGQSALARCIGRAPVFSGSVRIGDRECGANVYTGKGFADTEGAPFKAYYCVECAAAGGRR